MNLRHLQSKIATRVREGTPPYKILEDYADGGNIEMAASVLSTLPPNGAMRRHRLGKTVLILNFSLFALVLMAGLVDSITVGEDLGLWIGTLIATLGIVYGLIRNRYWAYVGVPVCILFGFLADLSDTFTVHSSGDRFGLLLLLGIFYLPGLVCALIAWRVRRSVFPFAGLMGPRRNKDGKLAILQELRTKPDNGAA